MNHIQQVTATFLMSMNLQNFPMDEHYLSIRLKSCVPASAPSSHCLRNTTSARKTGLKLARLKPFHDPTNSPHANKFSLETGFFCHWSWWADKRLVVRSRESNPEDSMGGATYGEIGACVGPTPMHAKAVTHARVNPALVHAQIPHNMHACVDPKLMHTSSYIYTTISSTFCCNIVAILLSQFVVVNLAGTRTL